MWSRFLTKFVRLNSSRCLLCLLFRHLWMFLCLVHSKLFSQAHSHTYIVLRDVQHAAALPFHLSLFSQPMHFSRVASPETAKVKCLVKRGLLLRSFSQLWGSLLLFHCCLICLFFLFVWVCRLRNKKKKIALKDFAKVLLASRRPSWHENLKTKWISLWKDGDMVKPRL